MTDTPLQLVGQKLRELREARGLSQSEVGRFLNVTKQTISQWERGEAQPRIQYLTGLAELYQITPSDIYAGAMIPTEHLSTIQRRISAASEILPVVRVLDLVEPTTDVTSLRPIGFRATHNGAPRDAFWIEIGDDANAPRFVSGDHVAIAPSVRPLPGQMVLARAMRMIAFRRYLPVAQNTHAGATLRADNPRWPQMVLTDADGVIGTMIEHVTQCHG